MGAAAEATAIAEGTQGSAELAKSSCLLPGSAKTPASHSVPLHSRQPWALG